MFWWTKDVLADDYPEKETCLSKTGYDLPLFFSGNCHYLYNQPDGWKQWGLSAGSNLHPVSPRRVEREGGHLGPLYQGGNGEALRLKCLHLQVKACIWGILESLIRANFVWRRANARFIEMAGSCALIGKGGSAFFSPFFLVLVKVRPLLLVERAAMWRDWEKSARVIYPLALHRRSYQSNQSPRNT